MKSNSVIETTIDGSLLTLTFSGGQKLEMYANTLATEIYAAAAMHGLKQKLCDAAAMSRNPTTGKPATVEEKYEAVKKVYERLLAGQWNAPREEGGANGGLLFRALCQLYPTKTGEDIRTWLDAKTKAECDALRKSDKIAAIIATLKPAKASNVDADALLAGLD